MTARTPSDQDERDRIASSLDRTLVVEAGAGTGKTRLLVDRVENLLRTGEATIDRIVAITFTRAAAAELRERIRGRLETLDRDGGMPEDEASRVRQALDGIDQAAIQTIHSFAESLVRERAVDAGLPLVIEPMDDVDAGLEFDERWRAWLGEVLEEPDFRADFMRAARLGLNEPVDRLREIALAFHGEYDRIRDAGFDVATSEVRVAARLLVDAVPVLEDLLPLSVDGEGDPLYDHTVRVIALARSLDADALKSEEVLGILARAQKIGTKRGSMKNWAATKDGENAAKVLKGLLGGIQESLDAELAQARQVALAPLLKQIQRFVLDYAEARRASGRAEFHDLLVWARDLLARSEPARAHFAVRFTHVLIDEFQDTDPLQIEIALWLTRPPGSDGSRAVGRPGALFAVGDPKQSIYRFRRADVSAMARLPGVVHGKRVEIIETFRSNTAIVEWVNHVFGDWMGRDEEPAQARYIDLKTAREPLAADLPQGVYIIGGERDGAIGEVREEEAQRIAQVALSVGAGNWTVTDRDADDEPRQSKFSDLCILFPRRTGLAVLERALQDAGVPYALEGRSLVFGAQEVRDILSALAAIDDPSDQVALVAALRSPLFGCSDIDLFRWRDEGGAFSYLEPEKGPGNGARDSGPIARALSALRDLHADRMYTPTPELIERLVDGRYLRHLSYRSVLGRERRRQVQVLLESARSLEAAGRSSLRAFVRWADDRARAGDSFPEGAASDIDYNAVRLMTTYRAKGLEFPIVLLSGINSGRTGRGGGGSTLLIDRAGTGSAAVRTGSGGSRFEFGDFESLNDLEKDAGAKEQVRVIYVAATRARDYLVASLFRKAGDKNSPATQIARRTEGADGLWRELPEYTGLLREPPVAGEAWGSEADFAAWKAEREKLLAASRRPLGVSATALKASLEEAAESKPAAPDAESRPWQRGRAATAIGRAVHAVMQDVDLATGDGIDELAERHAAAEEISGYAAEIARLARATLDSPVVKRAAASGTALREAYVAVPLGDGSENNDGGRGVLDGYIDLLFEDEVGNLVIVDFKTDRVGEGDDLATAAAPYEIQLGAYAHAVAATTGRKVSEAWLVFARRAYAGRPAEYRIPDLPAAAAKARDAARAAVGAG